MEINFTGHGVEINPALRSYTIKKFEPLHHRGDRITSINVTMNVEKLRQIAEATVHVAGLEIHAKSESEDMYKSIDTLADKLERQIIKHKEKMKEHRED